MEIRSCPYCDNSSGVNSFPDIDGKTKYYAVCLLCEGAGPQKESREEAIRAWNEVARLKGELGDTYKLALSGAKKHNSARAEVARRLDPAAVLAVMDKPVDPLRTPVEWIKGVKWAMDQIRAMARGE